MKSISAFIAHFDQGSSNLLSSIRVFVPEVLKNDNLKFFSLIYIFETVTGEKKVSIDKRIFL